MAIAYIRGQYMSGDRFENGIGVFSGTDETVEVGTNIRRGVILLTPIGSPAADEVLSVDETVGADNYAISIPDSGFFTVKRTGASKTADLKFSYQVVGYA